MGIVLQDTFAGRTVAAGSANWGTGSDGNAWSFLAGTANIAGVHSGEGEIVSSASYVRQQYASSSRVNSEIRARFKPSTIGAGLDVALAIFRIVDASNFYTIGWNAQFLEVGKVVAGTHSQIATVAKNADTTNFWRIASRVYGAWMGTKMWQDGTAEPQAWDLIVASDLSFAAAGPNGFALAANAGTSNLDSFTVDDLLTVGSPAWLRPDRLNRLQLRREIPYLSGQRLAYPSAAGPQLFTQTLAVTTLSVAALTKQVGKPLPVTTLSVTALLKQVGKLLAVVGVDVPALTKQIGKLLPATSLSIPSLTKQDQKPLSVSTLTVPALLKQPQKVLAVVTSSVPVLLKLIGKVLKVTSVDIPSLGTVKVKLVTLAVTTLSLPALSKSVGKLLAVTTASVPAMPRVISKVFPIASVSLPTLVKRVGKSMAAISLTIPVLTALQQVLGTVLRLVVDSLEGIWAGISGEPASGTSTAPLPPGNSNSEPSSAAASGEPPTSSSTGVPGQ